MQLGFKFTRRNREQIMQATEELKQIQEHISALYDKASGCMHVCMYVCAWRNRGGGVRVRGWMEAAD